VKKPSRTLHVIALAAALLFLVGCGPNGPSAAPRNAPVANGQGSMSTDSPDNHTAKPMVATPQFEENNRTRAYENGFFIDTDVNGSTVNIPSYWEVVSVQRHDLPLNLLEGRAYAEPIAFELNKASERLSRMYTVTFKVHVTETVKRFEVRTLTIPDPRVTFASQSQ